MKQYVREKDLKLINEILERGANVRIRKTSYHVMISCEDIKVLNKEEIEKLPEFQD